MLEIYEVPSEATDASQSISEYLAEQIFDGCKASEITEILNCGILTVSELSNVGPSIDLSGPPVETDDCASEQQQEQALNDKVADAEKRI